MATRSRLESVVDRVWRTDRLESTNGGAERALILAAAFVRLTAVAQTALALPLVARHASIPSVSLCAAAVYIVTSVVVMGITLLRGRVPGPRLFLLDLAVGMLALLHPIVAPSRGAIGSWAQWQFAAAMSIACFVALSLHRAWQIAAMVGCFAAAYIAGAHLGSPAKDLGTAYVNAAAFLFLVPAVYIVAGFLRSLADQLDRSRELNERLAAQAALAEERASQRMLLHDTAGLLSMISNTNDPAFLQLLRSQARVASRDIRRRVYQVRGDSAQEDRSLDEIVRSTAAGYADLPIEMNTLLAKRVTLSGSLRGVVSSALRTVLDNVRMHAGADSVTIHAAATAGGGWTLTVRDDGRGFDPSTQQLGFGLSEQVVEQCRRVGIEADIAAVPGEGTTITLALPGPETPSLEPVKTR